MLRTGYGAQHCDIRPPKRIRDNQELMLEATDLSRLRLAYPKFAGICGHRVTACNGLEQAGDLRFFTLLREPRSRFLSHFSHWVRDRDLAGTRDDFLRFCAEPIQANLQSRMLGGSNDPQASLDVIERHGIFVGLMEEFDASVVMLGDWLGGVGEPSRLPNGYQARNTGKKQSGLTIDEELSSLVTERNQCDLAVYEEVRASFFPAQITAYEADHGCLNLAVEEMRSRMETWVDKPEPLWAKVKRNFIYKPMRSMRAV